MLMAGQSCVLSDVIKMPVSLSLTHTRTHTHTHTHCVLAVLIPIPNRVYLHRATSVALVYLTLDHSCL